MSSSCECRVCCAENERIDSFAEMLQSSFFDNGEQGVTVVVSKTQPNVISALSKRYGDFLETFSPPFASSALCLNVRASFDSVMPQEPTIVFFPSSEREKEKHASQR